MRQHGSMYTARLCVKTSWFPCWCPFYTHFFLSFLTIPSLAIQSDGGGCYCSLLLYELVFVCGALMWWLLVRAHHVCLFRPEKRSCWPPKVGVFISHATLSPVDVRCILRSFNRCAFRCRSSKQRQYHIHFLYVYHAPHKTVCSQCAHFNISKYEE